MSYLLSMGNTLAYFAMYVNSKALNCNNLRMFLGRPYPGNWVTQFCGNAVTQDMEPLPKDRD
jgi:hypothetical protein